MSAILWVVVLSASVGAGPVGSRRAISTYPAVEGERHMAVQLCEAHAKILTANSETLAYYCKEIDSE